MGRPYGLLRAGFPYVKTLGMYRITNFPVDLVLGKERRLYVLCRQDKAFAGVMDAVRTYSLEDDEPGNTFGPLGEGEGQFRWPVSIAADSGRAALHQRRGAQPHLRLRARGRARGLLGHIPALARVSSCGRPGWPSTPTRTSWSSTR